MTFRIAVCSVVLAALLSAPCAAPPAGAPVPRPAAQAQIDRIVVAIAAADRSGPNTSIPALAEELQRLVDDDREALLLQLVLYLAHRPGNEQAMGAALLIDFYGFTEEEKIGALVRRLDTGDEALRDAIQEVLGTVDRPNGGDPDFEPYSALLRQGRDVPAGLIRYLFAVSPIDALEAIARANGGDAAASAAVQRAQPLEQMRLEPDTIDAQRAREEIDALSRDADWWVRLYAAHAVRAHPDLGSGEIVDRLGHDPHALVREALAG